MNTKNISKQFTAEPNELFALLGTRLALGRRVTAPLVAVILSADLANAANLLSNGDFNLPAATAPADSWTTWSANVGGSSWQEHRILNTTGNNANGNRGIYDGSYAMNIGIWNGYGACGIYQIVGGGPGASYTLTCDSGAETWWLPYGEIRLIFLDASYAVITNHVVRTTDGIHSEYNGSANRFDVGVVMQRWTNSAVSPVGTAFVKVEFSMNAGYGPGALGGSCWFDNAELTSPLVPPVIGNIYPNGAVLQQATNKLSFTATSALDITNIVLVLNGVNVSSNLVVTGPLTSRSVSYTNLQPNTVYNAAITVTDAGNLSAPAMVNFDTFAPLFTWEAEDYDYGSGQYINTPTPSGSAAAGSYFGLTGIEGVDFHDRSTTAPGAGTHAYRTGDWMAAEQTGDTSRQKFIDAGAPDYNVGWFDGSGFVDNVGLSGYQPGEWLNYTRSLPAGTYNIYGRVANGNGGWATIPLSKVVSGWGTSAQITSELGAFRFPANGWGSYAYVPLTDRFGNRVVVNLSGTNTLRVTAGSGGNLNFFMLVAPDTEQPTITSVYPDGRTLAQGTNKLTFTVSSTSHTIAQSNVVVTLNGVNVSSNLTFAGSPSSWNVSTPLAFNATNYAAVITVSDNVGNSHSTTLYFDTLDPLSYNLEAEDWDFSGGAFIDDPVITSSPAANSYFEKLGTAADSFEGDVAPPTTAPFRYRSLDTLSTDVCGDTPTRALVAAQQTDGLAFGYNIAYWSTNSWANYTHTYPAGSFRVYARLAGESGFTNQVRLEELNGSATSNLGTFTFVGRGYNYFDWVPLLNSVSGQPVTVTLDGVATLRATTVTGNLNPNSYLLVPLAATAEPLQWSYSSEVLTLTWSNTAFHLQAQTNTPGTGLSTAWGNYPGGGTSPVNIPLSQSSGSVFFRLSN